MLTPVFGQSRDTAFALHNLFKERRGRGLINGGYGLAGLSGLTLAAVNGQAGLSLVSGAVTLVSTAVGLRQLGRYSESREAGMVSSYEQGWPVPPELRRRLKAKHFRAL